MKKLIINGLKFPLVLIGCCVLDALAEVKPLHAWDFERTEGAKTFDIGSAQAKRTLYGGSLRPGQGTGGSMACAVVKGANVQIPNFPFAAEELTVDLSFRLDGAVDAREGNALWTFAWNSWRRGRILASITKEGRVAVSFHRVAAKDGTAPLVDFYAESAPQPIRPGRLHTLRVASAKDGLLTAYLDGVLIIKKSGCPGFQGLKCTSPKWYPLFRVGQNDDQLEKPKAFLNGVVDDLKIYDVALGAPAIEIAAEDYSGVACPSFNANAEGAEDVLVLKDGVGRTGKFAIKDREGDGIHDIGGNAGLGGFVRADEKFQKCRAEATISVKDDFVVVEVDCPVPPDMKPVKRTGSPWSGDAVELFIRPDLARPHYFHYCVNAAGLTAAGKYAQGSEDKTWKSGFTGVCRDTAAGFAVTYRIPRAEIFAALPKDGDVFALQIIREGETTFGVASWRPTGTAFHDASTFGRVVYGSTAAYFRNRVAEARQKAAKYFVNPEAKKAADKAVEAFAASAQKHGGEVRAFGALERMYANLDQSFLQIALIGRKLIAYRPADIWANNMEPDALTRPLEKIALRVAKGGRAFYSFALSNLSDESYLGQVKVFDKDPKARFNCAYAKGLARHFTVHEGFDVRSGAGRKVWDPVAPAAMGSVFRLSPHQMTTVWLELNAQGLEAGRHFAVLYLKKGMPGFATELIPVEVEVVAADLAETPVDRACYTYLTRLPENRRHIAFLVDHGFNAIYVGTPGQQALNIYNHYEKDGTLVPGDLTALDAKIDAHLRAGLARERVKLWFFLALEGWYGPGNAGLRLGAKWQAAMKAFLAQLYGHLLEKYGITADRIVLYPVDEPSGDIDDAKTKMSLAYQAGKFLKSVNPDYLLMVNPLPGIPEAEWRKALTRLAECYDFIEFYRPGLTPARVAFAKTLPYKGFWTYSILGKETHPVAYRNDYWENMRDGFTAMTTFWHLDAMAGGDGFDSTDAHDNGKNYADYGTVYADWDTDSVISSRRQIAADMGYEDIRLIAWCRAKAKGRAELAARVEEIVRRSADAGTMAALDEGREALLDLVKEL